MGYFPACKLLRCRARNGKRGTGESPSTGRTVAAGFSMHLRQSFGGRVRPDGVQITRTPRLLPWHAHSATASPRRGRGRRRIASPPPSRQSSGKRRPNGHYFYRIRPPHSTAPAGQDAPSSHPDRRDVRRDITFTGFARTVSLHAPAGRTALLPRPQVGAKSRPRLGGGVEGEGSHSPIPYLLLPAVSPGGAFERRSVAPGGAKTKKKNKYVCASPCSPASRLGLERSRPAGPSQGWTVLLFFSQYHPLRRSAQSADDPLLRLCAFA